MLSEQSESKYYVYILRNSADKLYIGQTSNLDNRLLAHHQKAVKFTSIGRTFEVVYTEAYSSRIDAMHREKQIKGWTRAKKEALVAGNLELLKKL